MLNYNKKTVNTKSITKTIYDVMKGAYLIDGKNSIRGVILKSFTIFCFVKYQITKKEL
tara:strand:- start:822 stop:995 length:174 start_codon:yes stop_codon:yes gene_type:complete